MDRQILVELVGFVADIGTRNQLFNIIQLVEKSSEFHSNMVIRLVDYTKGFDCVEGIERAGRTKITHYNNKNLNEKNENFIKIGNEQS